MKKYLTAAVLCLGLFVVLGCEPQKPATTPNKPAATGSGAAPAAAPATTPAAPGATK